MLTKVQDERIKLFIEFVINDQITMNDNKKNKEFATTLNEISKSKIYKNKIYKYIKDNYRYIEGDENDILNPCYYIMIVDALNILHFEIRKDKETAEYIAESYEEQYADGDWKR